MYIRLTELQIYREVRSGSGALDHAIDPDSDVRTLEVSGSSFLNLTKDPYC